MPQFRLPFALFAALILGGCYYSWYGDLRVQHNADMLANSVDEYQLPPQPVDRPAIFTMLCNCRGVGIPRHCSHRRRQGDSLEYVHVPEKGKGISASPNAQDRGRP